MNEKILLELGLSKVQSEIFTCLLQNGPKKASDIAKITKRPRGVAYKGLEELIDLGLAAKKENKLGVALFAAEHPANLEKVVERREKEFNKTKKEFISYLPDFISAYNLASNKPGVRFYEGISGFEKATFDTLTAKEEIYAFVDLAALEGEFGKINKKYAAQREKMKIKKKLIVADIPENRNFFKNFNNETTEVKFIKKEFYHFNSSLQIYNNKISYLTLDQTNTISVIIDDKNIYSLNKLIFEYLWSAL